MEDSKNTKENIITYASINSVGTIEKGKTNKPEREGKLIPHIRNSKNKYI